MSVAVVTGGAQGIGAAIGRALLNGGYKVCISDIKEDKGRDFVEELKLKYGSENVAFFRCDTTKESDYKDLLEFTLEEFKGIDLLINNAGILLEQDPKLTIDVNVMGPIYGCRAGLDYMSKSKGGKGGIIINTASIAGFLTFAPAPIYTASKHAVIGLTRSYAKPLHFNEHGVMFMALCPSFVNTQLLASFGTNTLLEGLDISDRSDVLSPDYVAQGVMKLLEDKINGSTLVVEAQKGYLYIGPNKELQDLAID